MRGRARLVVLAPLFAAILSGCGANTSNSPQHMKLTSSAFGHGAIIPKEFTCDGQNASPPLDIAGVPAEAKSLVIILEDPDAPRAGGFDHWVMWNIPPLTASVLRNASPTGATVGVNDAGTNAYTGPCPPSGTHHYHFKIFALDTTLTLPAASKKASVVLAMDGHILDRGELMGTYLR